MNHIYKKIYISILAISVLFSVSGGISFAYAQSADVQTSAVSVGKLNLIAVTPTGGSGEAGGSGSGTSSGASTGTANANEKVDDALAQSANYIVMALKWVYVFLVPILALIGKFMSNDWVVGNVLNVDTLIGVVWQYVRNIINISMMLYLLYLAGINIVSVGSIDFKKDIKQQLPKVAGVLVAVNFSFLICRTIIGVAGFVTTASFGIPNQIGPIIQQNMTTDPYPFIWAEPIGSKKITSASTGEVIGNTTNLYFLECVHKNYALSLDSLQLKSSGKMIIANPVVDKDGKYVRAWYDDYRRVIDVDKGRYIMDNQTGLPKVNDEFEIKLKNAKKEVAENAKAGDRDNIADSGFSSAYVQSADELRSVLSSTTNDGTVVSNTATVRVGGVSTATTTPVTTTVNRPKMYPYYSDCMTDWNDLFFSERNAMFIFAFNLMKVGEYENALGNISSVQDLLTRGVISIVFLCMFFAVAIALLLAVIIRGIMLWLMMALSPIWITTKIMGGNFGIKELDKLGSLEIFSSLAFMPAVLGFVLSMTFMMINYIKYIGKLESLDAGRFPLGALNIYYNANNPILGGISSIFDMMLAMLTVVAVWMAVKFAFDFGFKKTEGTVFGKLYENSVGRVLKTTDNIGKYMAETPFKTPLIPIPGMGKFSVSALSKLADAKLRSLETDRNDAELAMLSTLGGGVKMKPETKEKIKTNFKEQITDMKGFHAAMSPLNATEDNNKAFAVDILKGIKSNDKFSFDVDGTNITVQDTVAKALYNNMLNSGLSTTVDTILHHANNNPLDRNISPDMWEVANTVIRGKKANDEEPIKYDNGKISVGGKDNSLTNFKAYTAGTLFTTGQSLIDKFSTIKNAFDFNRTSIVPNHPNEIKAILGNLFTDLNISSKLDAQVDVLKQILGLTEGGQKIEKLKKYLGNS